MKFVGKVGFWSNDIETAPGVYESKILEYPYTGDVLQDNRRFQSDNNQNEIFHISNRISILSDLFMSENWASIKYVDWNNQKIKVTSVNVNYPRCILELGGIYNGEIET